MKMKRGLSLNISFDWSPTSPLKHSDTDFPAATGPLGKSAATGWRERERHVPRKRAAKIFRRFSLWFPHTSPLTPPACSAARAINPPAVEENSNGVEQAKHHHRISSAAATRSADREARPGPARRQRHFGSVSTAAAAGRAGCRRRSGKTRRQRHFGVVSSTKVANEIHGQIDLECPGWLNQQNR